MSFDLDIARMENYLALLLNLPSFEVFFFLIE